MAAALSLAGIGPDRTLLEIWADPALTRNTHRIEVEADVARFSMTIEGVPSENPRTGRIVPLSTIAALRGLVSELKVGKHERESEPARHAHDQSQDRRFSCRQPMVAQNYFLVSAACGLAFR